MNETQHTGTTTTPDPHAISRGLASGTNDTGETIVQTIGQVYDTSPEDLWDAVTSAERLPRWFAPVTGDLVQGGHYQIEGNASGTIRTCEPPREFTATWEFGGNTSWIAVRVSADGTGARLQLEHTAQVTEDTTFWDEYGPGATGVGWDLGFMGLAKHLATGEAITGDAAEGWETTAEGLGFITESSRLWAEASIAHGTAREDAEGARERTTAFYTGLPEA